MTDGIIAAIPPPSWHSYCEIYNLGHRYIADLLTVPVNVEEKADGSQFSFCKDLDGQLHIRTKGAVTYIDAPEKMFAKAAETVRELAPLLTSGWTYRAEYLSKPKHNSLAYARTPAKYLLIFDVNTAEADYMPYKEKAAESNRLGLEVVPLLYEGMLKDLSVLRELLQRGSPRDIGALIKEIPNDIRKECEADIRDRLFEYAWPKLARLTTSGFAEWYKEQLLAKQFAASPSSTQEEVSG